jgi:hypothetical protein
VLQAAHLLFDFNKVKNQSIKIKCGGNKKVPQRSYLIQQKIARLRLFSLSALIFFCRSLSHLLAERSVSVSSLFFPPPFILERSSRKKRGSSWRRDASFFLSGASPQKKRLQTHLKRARGTRLG